MRRDNPIKDMEDIYQSAVREVDPAGLIESRVEKKNGMLVIRGRDTEISENLSNYEKVIVLGVGKASARMASAMENILGDALSGGCIVTKYGHGLPLRKIRLIEAGHPVPDKNSLEGARALAQLADEANEKTLIISLVSGGGSSLLCLPAQGLSLEDKRRTTSLLLACGADINEMNCIRKHLSKIKGGGLAKLAAPARLINLILSDVIGDRIDTIASGIAAPDHTTFQDALSIVRKYDLEDKLPPVVLSHLSLGAQGHIPETPKANDPAFSKTDNVILGNNAIACEAACAKAKNLGYEARIVSTALTGEASYAGAYFARLAVEMKQDKSDPVKPVAVIAGGETTVTLRGKGRGGRNQEMALSFLCELYRLLPDSPNIFFLSAGTDGTDGPTDAAGAFVTPQLLARMKEIAASASAHLKDNDAYHFFEDTGLLFKTGPTYTNVCDIQILVVT